MKEIHFYSSKIKSLLMFIISSVFCYLFFHFYKKLDNENLFKVIISHLGFILFLFGFFYSIILLLRRKPLLTITNTQIIIHSTLAKTVLINFEDISSFFVSTTRFRGIKTTEYIFIVTKSSMKNKDSSKLYTEFSNPKHSIQTDILNIKTNDLLKILNDKLKNV